jgi:hypothetical protein
MTRDAPRMLSETDALAAICVLAAQVDGLSAPERGA